MAEARSANSRSARLKRVKVRRAVVLANAGAGTRAFNRAYAADLKSRLGAAFVRAGVTAEIRLVDGRRLRKAASRALGAARRGDIDAVIAGGGDGSIRAVASVLAGTRVPLGIIPLGTFNHFAKDLGLPLSLDGTLVPFRISGLLCISAVILVKVFVRETVAGGLTREERLAKKR